MSEPIVITFPDGTQTKPLDAEVTEHPDGSLELKMPPNAERFVIGIFDADEWAHYGPATELAGDWFKNTDLGNAERYESRNRNKLLFVKGLGWLFWDQRRWVEAETGEEVRAATGMVRGIFREAGRFSSRAATTADDTERLKLAKRAEQLSEWGRRSEAKERIKSVVDLGRSRPALVARVSDLDTHASTLNVANGILDLETLKLGQHDPRARHTKVTVAEFQEGCASSLWQEFLERILPDKAVRSWVQKMAGYSLLGRYSEYLPIAYGTGKNGKSVLLRALRYSLGDYATDAAPELLVAKRGNVSAGDEAAIADLRGRRFVTSVETSEGKSLDEKTVKRLTGENEITAKFMRQNHIRFRNQTAVWLATNHKPRIEGSDAGIWSRVALVPFEAWIPPSERDEDLGEKLEREANAILAWAVEGLRAFRQEGLNLPPQISKATEAYQEEMDKLGDWIAERCELVSGAITPIKWITDDYHSYCERTGTHPLGSVRFNQQLEQRGLQRAKERIDGRQAKVWIGIRLLKEDVHRRAAEIAR